MEKRVLKIKWKASGTKRSTSSSPDRVAALLLEVAASTDLKSSSEENILIESRTDMKRKRGPRAGQKKGKKSGPSVVKDPASAPVCVNTEDNISSDQNDDDQMNFEMGIEPPSLGSDKLSNISSIDADLPNHRSTGKAGPGRVKVKLRSSKVLEPRRSQSDAQTPSDTARSNPQAALEMNDVAMEKEDSTYSDGQTSEMQNNLSEQIPRKASSIKIKSSRGLGFSSDMMQDKNLNKLNSPPQMPSERNLVLSDNEKITDSSVPRNLRQRETKVPYRDPRYNEKELSAALAVIKKVMKMEAAGPFNAPVNPVALGIPDYFDIIDNPMDFGTICHDIEHGCKYINSEDVYKDVQFIWENCYKYNNKGDYIIDLMKRVKKNFMKYWMASGLYSDMPSNGATESTQIGDMVRYGHDKLHPKSKSKHKRRRYGIDRHKSDCLCAVCVVRRRRKERDGSQMAMGAANLSQEFKLEESSPVDNPCSEDATSSLDHSPESDANVDVEEAENEEKLETPEQMDSAQPEMQEILDDEMELLHNTSSKYEPSEQLPLEHGTREDSKQQSQEEEMDLDFVIQPSDQEDHVAVQEEAALGHDHRESGNKRESAQRSQEENPSLQENQSVLQICHSLFPSDRRSVWNGPHSLHRHHLLVRDSPIHAAVAAFMKQ